MELQLYRCYDALGTNGWLYHGDQLICNTIELPWLQNKKVISCIPEGTYPLEKRFSVQFGLHFQICNVPRRSNILIHPANYATRELRGCIAPVMRLQAPGKGVQSRIALGLIQALLLPIMDQKETIYLTIQKQKNENS